MNVISSQLRASTSATDAGIRAPLRRPRPVEHVGGGGTPSTPILLRVRARAREELRCSYAAPSGGTHPRECVTRAGAWERGGAVQREADEVFAAGPWPRDAHLRDLPVDRRARFEIVVSRSFELKSWMRWLLPTS